jgi:hypothetical protein
MPEVIIANNIKKASLHPDHPVNPNHKEKPEYQLHPIYPEINPNYEEPYDK